MNNIGTVIFLRSEFPDGKWIDCQPHMWLITPKDMRFDTESSMDLAQEHLPIEPTPWPITSCHYYAVILQDILDLLITFCNKQ